MSQHSGQNSSKISEMIKVDISIMKDKIEIQMGNITTLNVDAIVNAANTTLLGGGGVDGAIHRAAGPKLLEECKTLGGCKTGSAKITKGYNLPAKWVIHTVGPVWHGGGQKEDELLADCYGNCFNLAEEYRIKTVAFPAISTGVYRFPLKRATKIAITEAILFLRTNETVEKVVFICFSHDVFNAYQEVLDACE